MIATYDPDNPNTSRNVMLAQAIEQLVNLRFGRQDELEADRLGVRYMAQAGYDPNSMLDVMEILRTPARGALRPNSSARIPIPTSRRADQSRDPGRISPGRSAGLGKVDGKIVDGKNSRRKIVCEVAAGGVLPHTPTQANGPNRPATVSAISVRVASPAFGCYSPWR